MDERNSPEGRPADAGLLGDRPETGLDLLLVGLVLEQLDARTSGA